MIERWKAVNIAEVLRLVAGIIGGTCDAEFHRF